MNHTGARILIIDDSPTVRRLAELILSQQGYKVYSAENGEQGLSMVREIEPDVILVDYVMPKMNGHTFCKELRAMEKFAETPIILISSKGETVGQSFEQEFGVLHYFSKPFEPDDLTRKLDEVLSARPPSAEQALHMPDAACRPVQTTDGANDEMLGAFQERFDKIVRCFFQKDLPLLMKNVMSDTLRQSGLVKGDTLVFSGDLSRVPLPDVLNFADNSRLSGRLTVFSREVFGEIFLDKGQFVFATVSRRGSHQFLTDLIRIDRKLNEKQLSEAINEARESNSSVGRVLVDKGLLTNDELMDYLKKHALHSFAKILEVKGGSFYLEADDLPNHMADISFRMPLTNVLLDGLNQLDEKDLAESEFADESLVLVRLITNEDALDEFNFGERELLVFAIIDGRKTLAEIIELAGIDPRETKYICYVLRRVGLLKVRHQKG